MLIFNINLLPLLNPVIYKKKEIVMKLKCALLALSALSSSAFADTFNLSTVVSKESQNKIIKEAIR